VAGAGIKDVAARAGVSVGTVSNVLNRPGAVAEGTRTRVLAAISELGYVRNEAARALRAGRSKTLGLVMTDLGNPFMAVLAHGVEAVADAHDTLTTLHSMTGENDRARRHLEQLEEQRVQGVLVATPADEVRDPVDELVARGTPVVVLDIPKFRGGLCHVMTDDVLGGTLVAQHLVEQGHDRFAFIGGSRARPVAARLQGLREGLEAAGLAPPEVVETRDLAVATGRATAARLASLPPGRRPTALVCGNDVIALGVLQGLSEAGVRVPDDMALVGYDDIRFAAAAAVPVTSVRVPAELMGRTAAELLFEEIDDPSGHRHRHVVFQPELVVRESSVRTAPAARRRRTGSA
jgi:LacI family transcriptional regulator